MSIRFVEVAVLALLSLASSLSPLGYAQVRPQAPPVKQGKGVTPLPEQPRIGQVLPLPADAMSDVKSVYAVGTATIIGDNVQAARKAALQSAYADAVAQGAGVEIGRLTLVRNVRAVTDLVASRSRGFVRRYSVLFDDVVAGPPVRYEVRIEAEVSLAPRDGDGDIEGLRLFLSVVGEPTLLILLPDAEVQEPNPSTWARVDAGEAHVQVQTSDGEAHPIGQNLTALGPRAQEGGVLRLAESAVAQAFARFGYRVLTSDDLLSSQKAGAGQLDRARRGVTADALAVARAAGADLLLTGVLRVSTQRIAPQGVAFVSATTAASAKALVVSNGYVIDAFNRTFTKAHASSLGAVASTMEAAAGALADTLAWKIPSLLSAQPRVTQVTVEQVDFDLAQRAKAALEKVDGIEAVRFDRLPTAARPVATFEVLTAYVTPDQSQFVDAVSTALGRPVRLQDADKFSLHLVITR